MSEPILELRNLSVSVTGQPEIQILKGIDLAIRPGEIHALMGPNGSGKSTLASAIAGNPAYTIDGGRVIFKGADITELKPDARARLGLFLSFQYPTAIPGVTMVNLMRASLKARRGQDVPPREFLQELRATLKALKMDESFARRYVNDGFSGGEKKRAEILQLGMLKPEMAILDETDSGLDVDALRTVAEGVNALRTPEIGILIITHYQRILNYITPDVVHVLVGGRIARSGGPELALQIEEHGYDPILKELGIGSEVVA
ncbi:MAG: Fe-S cluster assembly ATPase SufC [Candidatus Rokubacteria bacterium]|nr:Fe-S cluster assembly ATPase SufC [Chloroflexota bacterium]MBM4441471.1 Fe-S cluster assembly ATPase SufC [Candidatus Rokubacteria bacterium]